jgi:helix-turn-helix protein
MDNRRVPREQGRYRLRHRGSPDRLFTTDEMAELLGTTPRQLRRWIMKGDGRVPPAIQPGGTGGQWYFSERAYHNWLSEKGLPS